ncbi:hypothetical protein ZIOFF_018519 [Zingiber officinale]|uniref:Uncharacterized protein n=1 Tax=Zingiber officinale TaxID=94328 RepID=A0A8J5HQG0_ZINOF|nr:hypothetical protein ZIOFF_018519 [Zingiber officinale]
MELMGILHGSSKIIEQNLDGHLQSCDKPWHPVDLATNARTLVWQGLEIRWLSSILVILFYPIYIFGITSGEKLQVLYDIMEFGQTCSMASGQVLEVPPASEDGSANVISINHRGVDIQKVIFKLDGVSFDTDSCILLLLRPFVHPKGVI